MKTKTWAKRVAVVAFTLCLLCVAAIMLATHHSAGAASDIILQVDTLGYGRTDLPNGYAGKSYPVFECGAVDMQGNEISDIRILVFDPTGKILPIKNGRFDTPVTGNYGIEYTARNGGSTVIEVYTVTVLASEAYTPIAYTIHSEIPAAAYTGQIVLLPEGTYEGGAAEVRVATDITYSGDHTCVPALFGASDSPYFIPETEGTYRLTYTVTDIVGEAVKQSKDITVTDDAKPILRTPSIAATARKGVAAAYPVTEAVLYRDGAKIFVPVKTFVNETEITQSMTYTPTEAGQYTVKYSAVNLYDTSKVAEYSRTVTVYGEPDENEAYANRFFALENLSMAYRAEEAELENFVTVFTANAAGASAKAEFGTPIREETLSIALGTDGTGAEFEALSVRFTDSKHADESVVVSFVPNGADPDYTDVLLNGKHVNQTAKTFTPSDGDWAKSTFTVEYDAVRRAILDGNGEILATVPAYENGTVFRGFTSGSAYCGFEMTGVTDTSAIKLYRLSGQTISDAASDTLAPLLIYRDGYMRARFADIGETVTIGHIDAFDLFDAAVTVTASVRSPSGKEIYSGDVSDNPSIQVDEYGAYSVSYIARDTSGRERNVRAVINVVDRIAPTLKLPAHLGEVKAGGEYTLAAATATDNYSEKVATWISITDCDGITRYIDGDEKGVYRFTFTKAGAYTVTYGAVDGAGNRTVKSYTAVCK